MKPRWKNEIAEAWILEDGTLVVKKKVPLPEPDKQGFDHCYLIDTLPKIEQVAA